MKKANIIKAKIKQAKRLKRQETLKKRHSYLNHKIKEYIKKSIVVITFSHFAVKGKKLKKLKSACKSWKLKHLIIFFGKYGR